MTTRDERVFRKSSAAAFDNFLMSKYERYEGVAHTRSYPYIMMIDPSNICQLRCPTCRTGVINEMRREQKAVTFARPNARLERSIVDSIFEECGDLMFSCHFYNWSEPLLHDGLPDFIRAATARDIFTKIDTNLSLRLSDAKLEALLLSGLGELNASIDGFSQATYEQYRRGGRFDLALGNLTRLAAMRDRLGARTRLTWNFLVFAFNEHEIADAAAYCKQHNVNFNIKEAIIRRSDWLPSYRRDGAKPGQRPHQNAELRSAERTTPAGPIPAHIALPEHRSCGWHYGYTSVRGDGGVSPCCGLYLKRYDFGDVSDSPGSFGRVWNNASYTAARRIFPGRAPVTDKNPVAVCSQCKLPDGFLDHYAELDRVIVHSYWQFPEGSEVRQFDELFMLLQTSPKDFAAAYARRYEATAAKRTPDSGMKISALNSQVSVPDRLPDDPDPRKSRPHQGAVRHRIFRYLLARAANRGGTLVDLGANFGMFAKIARGEGYAVTAIDARTERKPPQEELESIQWVQSDVRNFDVSGFDVILCPGLLFHFDLDDQLRLLKRCADAKVPVILDTQIHVDALAPAGAGDWARTIVSRGSYEGVVNPVGDPSMAWLGDRETFWPTEESMLAMFADAGFRNAAVVDPLFTSKFGARRFFLLNCETPAGETPAEIANRERNHFTNLVNEGRFDEAREKFAHLHPSPADTADWTWLRAVMQMHEHFGEPGKVAATLVQLRDRFLEFGEAYSEDVLECARSFEAAGDPAEAERTRSQIFERLSNPAFMGYLTLRSIKSGAEDDARRILGRIEGRFADDPELVEFAIQNYQSIGDFAAMERVCRAALEREPQNTALLASLAEALSGQDKPEDAAAVLERALALEPENTKTVEQLTSLYLKLRRFDEAERNARALLAHSPDNPRFHLFLASALKRTKRRQEALNHARRAMELAPGNERYRKYADDLAELVAKKSGARPVGADAQ
jgi:MoaA/NifB/PqqE/SkfB family radical SAM enzyme/tetratricopeptide (TPR) repeat protein